MNFAPRVDTTLLSRSFTVSRSAVGVPQSMSELWLLPPKVSLVRLVSSFCGRTLHTIWAYVTSFHRSGGTSSRFMKKIVFVPSTLPGIPWASRPISLPNEYPQSSLYFGRFIRCLYSSSSPVSASRTEPAKSVRNSSGYCLRDACRLVGALPDAQYWDY